MDRGKGFAREDGSNCVTVISDTVQEFRGKRYYLCGFYFQRVGMRLHRAVWEHHNGSVPPGLHVHHVDGNRSNNDPRNLVLLHRSDHLSLHSNEPDRIEKSSRNIELAREAAKEWHASPAGREWHRKHYHERGAAVLHQREEMECSACGKRFEGLRKLSIFCSNACKSRHRRASGVDNVTRSCAVCGCGFEANRFSKTATCSRECGRIAGWAKRREVRGGDSAREG